MVHPVRKLKLKRCNSFAMRCTSTHRCLLCSGSLDCILMHETPWAGVIAACPAETVDTLDEGQVAHAKKLELVDVVPPLSLQSSNLNSQPEP